MGIPSRFLAPQPMLAAPLLPGPGSGDEEGWKVASSGRDFRHVGLSGVFQAHWRCLVGEKGEKRSGGSPGGRKHKLSLEKCIEDGMMLGVRWEGSVGPNWKG